MDRERFDALVDEALRELPDEFRDRMENIAITVEHYPTRHDLSSVGLDDKRSLLGLFRGVPAGKTSYFYSGPIMPSEIVLFQKNIEAMTNTEEGIIEQIRITLLHEIGHHFGMTEEELEEYS